MRRELADPLVRNGYALIANTGATGVLGLAFWLLTARFYPAATVGRASAAYAAMNVLAGVTALNFNGVLTRFIPEAGRATRVLIMRAYAVSAVASVGLAFLFVLVARWFGPSYSELGRPIIGLVFVGCVVAWAIFTLQDSVLVGLRSAFWVFAENSIFGLAKLVLLVLLVQAIPDHAGIYVSWMLPVFVAVPLVNLLIFGSLVPRHIAATRGVPLPSARQIVRFLEGDYSGAMFLLISTSLVPVLVATRVDATSTAYFYVAWLIYGIVDMIGVNMGMSLTVEGAFQPATLAANCRKAFRRMATMLVPCAVLLALFAPWWLRLFGTAYAAHGARVLELLAVATLPTATTEIYLGALRAQNRTSLVALIQGARAFLLLVLMVTLTATIGTVGAGVAALTSQTAIAVAISPGLWRVLAGTVKTKLPAPEGGQRMTTQARHRMPAHRVTTGVARSPQLPSWAPAAAVGALTVLGLIMFFVSLRGVDLGRMNGLGLVSVLPSSAIAGVALVALSFMIGLALPRAHRTVLGCALVALVVCLDGITAFVESEPRFPTAYQIAGYVQYVSTTGHASPGLAAYFSWPGFFALVSFVTRAAGTNGLLVLMRVWPVAIDLLCLPPLFLMMRNLRISWRAQWLAGFLFAVGNWVGQDYFSPQAFGYLLYLVFIAILINWFIQPDPILRPASPSWPARLHRWLFGNLQPGERLPLPAGTGQKTFLLALLIALFTVTTVSHQLTPFFMIAACAALVLVRRCSLTGLPVLLVVILVGWVSYQTVGFWSGHLSSLVSGFGDLFSNTSVSVGGRLSGSSATHVLALRARVVLAAVVLGLAALGALRRRRRGMSDRVLLVLLFVPLLMVVVQSYGGEIGLRIYLFMLPAACPLGASLFFPDPHSGRPRWRALTALVACALILPAGFLLARYGNEAFEQTPPGELTAMNWIYAHDAQGVRVLWLSTAPQVDVTPDMPWDYTDQTKMVYIPTQAPLDPTQVNGLVSALRVAGPGSYLIVPQTEVATMQQTASYPSDWGQRFNAAMSAAPDVRVAFSTNSAVVYTLNWPPGARPQPLGLTTAGASVRPVVWSAIGVGMFWLLILLLGAREFVRVYRPAARLTRPLYLASFPLFVVFATVIILRFITLT